MNLNPAKILTIALFPVFLLLSSCGGGGAGSDAVSDTFPIDEPLSASLVSQGLPQDVARFFAAAKFSSSCSSDTRCTVAYTYPNGAKRNLTLTATASQYTPTADELVNTAAIVKPVYNGSYAGSGIDDSTPAVDTQVAISYFVPLSSMARGVLSSARNSPLALEAAQRTAQLADGPSTGYQFNWSESGSKGADVAIGSIIDHFKDIGGANATGSVYAAAAAMSDVASAAIISKQVKAWLSELDALEKCAADPTNPITQSDPNYTAATVANLHAARAELKRISAVRFINVMGETSAGLHPATAVLSIPLKQGYAWTEQTLKDASETLMQDARSSVVSCKPSCPTGLSATPVSESQIDLAWSGSIGDNEVTGYIIEGGNAAGQATIATTFSDTGLNRSTNYCYTVSAYNDYGSAENCAQACATTFGPPVVVSTGPTNNATGVSVQTALTATFSRAVDSASIDTGTFTLIGSGAVAGTVSFSGTTATFNPAADLAYSTKYTATLTTGIIDLDGIALEANYSWSFTTESPPLAGNLQFTTTVTVAGVNTTNGVANVSWALLESLPDVRTYIAAGTISGQLSPVLEGFTCSPVAVTSNIASSDRLLVYTALNSVWPGTHAFTVTADDMNTMLTTNCTEDDGGGTISIPFSKLLYVFVGGGLPAEFHSAAGTLHG
ncbi:MAG: Ig-like domain-containing protein [Gammaproteobacteria bacterium]|nr:Ig-like domain-containing protein [Gammaproteobacteria bacterium]MBL6999098.1 Ig-like domain-containing protein [Gammaproteobacteria bacterium]